MKIYPSNKIYITESKIHGLGVFAAEKILKDELIEITPLYNLGIDVKNPNQILTDYRFNWPQGNNPSDLVLAFGYGSLYNHSDTYNADWKSNFDNFTFEFYAVRDIEKDEEILVYYGDENYWNIRNKAPII
jgi:SET domain-containing protein